MCLNKVLFKNLPHYKNAEFLKIATQKVSPWHYLKFNGKSSIFKNFSAQTL